MKDGFALIEVLLASLISSILGVILFTAYYQSNKVTMAIDNFIDVYSKEALLQTQLERDIIGSFIPQQAYEKEKFIEDVFMSKNQQGITEFLTFITNNPLTAYQQTKPRIVRVVYRLKEDSYSTEHKKSYALLRQESAGLDVKLFKEEKDTKIKSYELVDGIKEFTVSYYALNRTNDRVEIEKKEVWPAEQGSAKKSEQQDKSKQDNNKKDTDEQDKKIITLPDLVIIHVTLWDAQKKRERSFSIRIPLITFVENDAKSGQPEKKKSAEASVAVDKKIPQTQPAPESKSVTTVAQKKAPSRGLKLATTQQKDRVKSFKILHIPSDQNGKVAV
jgi:prepilin-type N-terminal cleavage/methylation domain-containing protein